MGAIFLKKFKLVEMRINLLWYGLSFFALAFSCGPRDLMNSAGQKGISDMQDLFVAEEHPGVECFRIPALATATNGDLIAAIDERVPGCADLRGSRDINIVVRRSTDHGETWSDIETIVDFPDGQSASDPSMIVDEVTGDIFLFYNYMDLDKELNVYYLHVVKSEDHGKTWSEPVDITQQITKPGWHDDFKFITSGTGMQTREGWLVHTLVNLDHGLHIFGSRDHGESWFLFDVPIEVGDESKIVELSNGDWMINSRVNQGGKRYLHFSSDKGQSWQSREAPVLTDPGNNAGLVNYTLERDGQTRHLLLFSNTNDESDRRNLTIKYSEDGGQTWSSGKTIYAGSAAYSDMSVLENGHIGLFFERDDYTRNTFVKFSIDWLLE